MSLLEPLLKQGVPWTKDRGKETPAHFGDPGAEIRSLLEQSALVDFSHRGNVAISGSERINFLGGLVTNQVKELLPERSIYTTMLTPQGRFLWDFTLIDHGSVVSLDTEPDSPTELVRLLDFYRLRSKVDIRDQSHEFGMLGVAGPAAVSALHNVFPELDLLAATPGRTWQLGDKTRLWRDPRHPDFGFRLQVPANDFINFWQRLQAAIPPAGFSAWEGYRILRGLPRGGSEWISGSTLPLEAGALEMNAISFQKGCYVGQETTARTHHRGTLKKRLFCVTIDTDEAAPSQTPVVLSSSGKEVGVVTSAVVHDGKSQGLALLRLEDVASGSPMTILGGRVSAVRPQWATWE